MPIYLYMKRTYICLILAILFTSCATSYKDAVRSEYIGNGTYEIRSDGNKWSEGDAIRNFSYRKAFETCESEGKGFVLVGAAEDTGKSGLTGATTNQFGYTTVYTAHTPGARMLIKCEGPVDEKLRAKYAHAEN